MVEKLEVGLRLKAMYSDGEFYPATVVEISESKRREKAPVKVSFTGYGDESNAWVGIDKLLSKRLPKAKAAEPKAKAKAKAKISLADVAVGAYAKATHPREWAIWSKIDADCDNRVTTAEIRDMCRKFDVTEHAQFLADVMDPAKAGSVSFNHFCKNFKSVSMVRQTARLKQWSRTFGLGVAGNVAGHMAQAGEAVAGAATNKPAACFTFYEPHPHTVDATTDDVLKLLENFPVTNAIIDFPKQGGNVQVEPELGLYCDIVYSRDERSVERLVPRRVAAFNDCSIRELDGAVKLSEKKNWGFGSKGISVRSFRVPSISKGTMVDNLVLSSYIKRGDETFKYSVDAPARNYLMFHDELLDWIVDRINNQKNESKWEEIFPALVKADYPTSIWIALGSGEYTEWGAKNYLQRGDECLVLLYNELAFPTGPDGNMVKELFEDRTAPKDIIALHQTFV